MLFTNNLSYFYYDAKGRTYTSKYQAALENKKIKFYYKDDYYSTIDWKTEPKESLNELYVKRAKQLRDEYDYLILAYSGGHDSSNILETFYFNNIHLDEIFVFGAFSFDTRSESDENHNGEIYKVCIPTLNKMNLSKTKISIVDYSLEMNNVIIPMMDNKWLQSGTMCQGPMSLWLTTLRQKFEKRGKKVGVIFGIDKPSVRILPNLSATVSFNDNSFFSYGINMLNYLDSDTPEFKRIFFYWDSENAEILRKQCFSVYDFFCKKILANPNFVPKQDSSNLMAQFMQVAGHKWHRMVLHILYDLKFKIEYISTGEEWGGDYNSPRGIGKSFNIGDTLAKVLSGHDAYLRRKSAKNTELRKLYLQRLYEIHPWPWPDSFTLPVSTQEYYFIKP